MEDGRGSERSFPRAFRRARSREAEERTEPCGEDSGAERSEVVVEITAFGDDDGGRDARPRAAPGEAFGGPFTLEIVVAGDDDAPAGGRG